jgi:hypothetical protein
MALSENGKDHDGLWRPRCRCKGVLQLQDMRNVYQNCILVSALCFLVRPGQHVSGSQGFRCGVRFEAQKHTSTSDL